MNKWNYSKTLMLNFVNQKPWHTKGLPLQELKIRMPKIASDFEPPYLHYTNLFKIKPYSQQKPDRKTLTKTKFDPSQSLYTLFKYHILQCIQTSFHLPTRIGLCQDLNIITIPIPCTLAESVDFGWYSSEETALLQSTLKKSRADESCALLMLEF